uniref:Sugar transporter SWEET1 n=1 Tax=Globisporangium ultimum (strain ATCC 200006 / CBS 805.95 / DAOM BR144) TaxID=431595 RepID=K3WZZ2_GLOUD
MPAFEIVVKVLASTSAVYMCFSPAPTMLRIHRQKTTGSMPVLPLVTQWSYNHIWMLYGYIAREYFPLVATYAVGSVLSIGFLIIYYSSASIDQRAEISRLVAATLLFNMLASVYAFTGSSWQPHDQVAQVVGAIAIACGFLLYASPLATISRVVRTKSTASVPIAMVSVGAISNAIWIVYGVLQHDLIIVIPTVVNTALCIVQLILFIVYHPRRPSLKAM